jgi:hypothetical protein
VLYGQCIIDQAGDALQHVCSFWGAQLSCRLLSHKADGVPGKGAVQAPGHQRLCAVICHCHRALVVLLCLLPALQLHLHCLQVGQEEVPERGAGSTLGGSAVQA